MDNLQIQKCDKHCITPWLVYLGNHLLEARTLKGSSKKVESYHSYSSRATDESVPFGLQLSERE